MSYGDLNSGPLWAPKISAEKQTDPKTDGPFSRLRAALKFGPSDFGGPTSDFDNQTSAFRQAESGRHHSQKRVRF